MIAADTREMIETKATDLGFAVGDIERLLVLLAELVDDGVIVAPLSPSLAPEASSRILLNRFSAALPVEAGQPPPAAESALVVQGLVDALHSEGIIGGAELQAAAEWLNRYGA